MKGIGERVTQELTAGTQGSWWWGTAGTRAWGQESREGDSLRHGSGSGTGGWTRLSKAGRRRQLRQGSGLKGWPAGTRVESLCSVIPAPLHPHPQPPPGPPPLPLATPAGCHDDRHLHSPSGECPLRWLLPAAAAVAWEHLQTPVARAALLPRVLHGAECCLPVRLPRGAHVLGEGGSYSIYII